MRVRAYLMTELLIVLIIASIMMMIYLPKVTEVNYDDYLFMADYLKTQSNSMVLKEMQSVDNKYNLGINYPIFFNKDGNVNQAQTIKGNKHNIIVHLGNGYLTYE